MKYDHIVKFNGVYYPAGADVPAGDSLEKGNKVEKPIEIDEIEREPLPFEFTAEEEVHKEETPKRGGRKKKTEQ